MRSITMASRALALIAALILIAGCAGRPAEPEIRYTEVPMPIPVGCVTSRPAAVLPLKARIPTNDWAARAPGAKAQAVRGQAGHWMNHADALGAATAACPNAPASEQKGE